MKLGRNHGGADALHALGSRGISRQGFDPSRISGLVLWLDADVNITLNSGNVSVWGDKSTTGASLQQATPLNQPHYTTNAVNGHSAVTPNDANDRVVDATHPDLSNLAGYTSFVVFKLTAATELLVRTAEASASIADAMEFDTSNIIRFVGGATQTGQYAFSSTAAFHINEALYDGSQTGNANRLKVFHDGAQQTLTFAGTIPATTGAGCAGYQVGHSAASGGNVAAVIVYNRALTASERSQVGQYLGARYAITTSY